MRLAGLLELRLLYCTYTVQRASRSRLSPKKWLSPASSVCTVVSYSCTVFVQCGARASEARTLKQYRYTNAIIFLFLLAKI
uniref:Uncharacterized protein n=1 Tax=Arundo donax TaxID=35708 RepID=A0A0A9C921_ARUDO